MYQGCLLYHLVKSSASLSLSGPRPANRCTWTLLADRTWRINTFLGRTVVSSSVFCAHYLCHFARIMHRRFLWVSPYSVTTQHSTYDVVSFSLLPYREQTCRRHSTQQETFVWLCIQWKSPSLQSDSWQKAKTWLRRHFCSFWEWYGLSQREGSESGVWAEKTRLVYCCLQA